MREEREWVWGWVYVGGPARTSMNHVVGRDKERIKQ